MKRQTFQNSFEQKYYGVHDTAHMGIEACLHQARRIFYWPGLAKEMNDYVMFCAVCQQNQPQQRKEPMQAHLVPDVPWQVVATDLFTLEHRDYIVITDYFSNGFVAERLVGTKTYDVVDKMKKNILAFRNTRESFFKRNERSSSCAYSENDF